MQYWISNPSLHHFSPYEAIERTLRQCSGQSAYEPFFSILHLYSRGRGYLSICDSAEKSNECFD
jgi:hypothetical protein